MPANDDTPRAMDVLHPAQAAQPTTSRPVIVSNRPMIAEDPMIARAVDALDTEPPAGAAPVREQAPLVDSAVRHEKTIASPQVDDKIPAPEGIQPDTPVVSAPLASDDESPVKTVSPPEEMSITSGTSETGMLDTHVVGSEAKRDSKEAPKATPADGIVAIDGEEAVELSVDDAEEKRRLELESMITEGRYAVPIGQMAKRRRTIVTVIALSILLLVLLNFALDAGLFDLPFVPHTSFFG